MGQYFPLLAVAAYGIVIGVIGLAFAMWERAPHRSRETQRELPLEERRHAVASR